MVISATVESAFQVNRVTLKTGANAHGLDIAPKPTGYGSSANGGELLCLAVATCYSNDLYREAAKLSMTVEGVEVHAQAEFGGEGEAARRIRYGVRVRAKAAEAAIRELVAHTDTVAEIHNTLRLGIPVTLESIEAVSVG